MWVKKRWEVALLDPARPCPTLLKGPALLEIGPPKLFPQVSLEAMALPSPNN